MFTRPLFWGALYLFFLLSNGYSAPRKANFCAAQLVGVQRLQGIGHADETADVIARLRGFRISILNQPLISAKATRTINADHQSRRPGLERRLASRIRFAEEHFNGKHRLDFISGIVLRKRSEIEMFLNELSYYSEGLNQYHPGLTFGHYFFWFFAINAFLSSPNTFLNPSNPHWEAQLAVAVPAFFVFNTDGLLNRIFGNGHFINRSFKAMLKAIKKPAERGWQYSSYELQIPEALFASAWGTKDVLSNAMAVQLGVEDVGRLRQFVYKRTEWRSIEFVWVGVEMLLIPQDGEWDLVMLIRSDKKRPRVSKPAVKREGANLLSTQLQPAIP